MQFTLESLVALKKRKEIFLRVIAYQILMILIVLLNGYIVPEINNIQVETMYVKWMCKYHIVFTPKYRRKVIYNQLKADIRDILRQLCSYKGVEIIEGYLMPDHIHMLVSIPPKMSISSFMGYLKGKSALMIFDKHANLKYKFGNRHFWSEGYYVSTVGLNEATIKKYIQDQEKYDIMQDKLSVKEYEDPFKG